MINQSRFDIVQQGFEVLSMFSLLGLSVGLVVLMGVAIMFRGDAGASASAKPPAERE